MNIRKARTEDLAPIMRIYRNAQDFMIESGNPGQWGHEYPSGELIRQDISGGNCYVLENEKEICAVFALFEGIEPAYRIIEQGQWLNDEPYVTVHRVAKDWNSKGVVRMIQKFLAANYSNIRIDTHEKNLPMRSALIRNGFSECGIIYVRDHSPRIAYQWANKGGNEV